MTATLIVILVFVSLILAGYFARWLLENPRGDFEYGVALALGRVYARVFHNLQVHGKEHIPPRDSHGPIILVANHTAGIDPILVQAACPLEIRWIMAEDMRASSLEWLWKWQKVIFVGQESGPSIGVRTALEHLARGGVIGIFPEGGLERPRQHLLPFRAGLGLLVKRSGARVLPVLIDGTPQIDPAWASLWRPSSSSVSFGPLLSYERSVSAQEIADRVRQYFVEWSGWPTRDTPSDDQLRSDRPSLYPKRARANGTDELSAA